MHPITPSKARSSGKPRSRSEASEVEIHISVMGLDDTSFQPVHAQSVYNETSIVWGARLADILSEERGRGRDPRSAQVPRDRADEAVSRGFPYPMGKEESPCSPALSPQMGEREGRASPWASRSPFFQG